jgi:cystathionine beta-synthase
MDKKSSLKFVESVEELIGHTPLVKLKKSLIAFPLGEWMKGQGITKTSHNFQSEIFAKVEFTNPGGSVKDRIALHIINEAEKRGDLKPGGTIVEATSGNTGAGLAVVAASRGYKVIFVMPDKMSAEKINALRAFGAKVVIAPAEAHPEHPNYYCNVAKTIAEKKRFFLANQYFTPDNPKAHELTTGPEIWEQMEGRIDFFAAGIGTGGTLSGTARYLKSKNPKINIVAVDPLGSIYASVIKTGKKSDPAPYLVEGVGEDMIPGTMDLGLPTEVVTVNDFESLSATRMLAQKEGLLVGGSCGTAFMGACFFAAKMEILNNKKLRGVVLLPDSGSRYLSKIFNPVWLQEKSVETSWPDMSLGGEVQYLSTSKKVEGVKGSVYDND